MKITLVKGNGNVYTSNVYLVTGDWKRIEDVNTLVDAGSDPSMLGSLNDASTGVGKRKVEQVVLTHCHFDHTQNLSILRAQYHPIVYAFSPFLAGVDRLVTNGGKILVGDRIFEVIHTPGHTEDSVCFYQADEGVLFSGDAPLLNPAADGTYEPRFIQVMERLCRRRITAIYPGHGEPVLRNAYAALKDSLETIRAAHGQKG